MELEIMNEILDFLVNSKLIMMIFAFIVSLFVTVGAYFSLLIERKSIMIYIVIFMISFLLCIGLFQLIKHFRAAFIIFFAVGGIISGLSIYAQKTDLKEAMITFLILIFMTIYVLIIVNAFYYYL